MNLNDPDAKIKALATAASGAGSSASPLSPAANVPPPEIPDYELIKRIGEGSYGEVWLARSVMGTCRAVKIVHRHVFKSDRPFEREFEGIKKFEPVSQTHECQLKIFHVGRRNGYFYYVMELADNAAEPRTESSEFRVERSGTARTDSQLPTQDALNYVPKTLRSELQRRGRLPVEESLDLSLKLTQALAHLHGHGLVHRDIKPSNIIFVKGQPKLADIGLVADTEGTLTFVGTEGYLPPEGPGKPSADIFGLGKVLYEIGTGHDRNHFPELPARWDSAPEREAFAELNEVIIKACAADTRQRYESAEAMHQDLLLLQAGKSVRRKRGRERLARAARKAAMVAAMLLLVGVGGFLIAGKPAPVAIPSARRLIVDETVNRFYVGEFRAGRQFDFSPDGRRILFAGMRGLSIWDTKTEVNRLFTLPGFAASSPHTTNQWMTPNRSGALPRWAPDSQRFIFQAVKTIGGTPEEPARVWALFLVNADTSEFRQIGSEQPDGQHLTDLCWRPDGKALTYTDRQSRLYTLTLDGERSAWADARLPGQRGISLGGYSPDGNWLVISTDTGAKDSNDDQDLWLLPHGGGHSVPIRQRPGLDAFATWEPDGQSVFFISSGGHYSSGTKAIWKVGFDSKRGIPKGESTEIFRKEGHSISHLKFVANGKHLMYSVEEPNTRVWVAVSNRIEQANEVLRGQRAILSPDGATVYYVDEPKQRGIFALDQNGKGAPRKLTELIPLGGGATRGGLSLSPDGASIAMFAFDGKRFGVFVVPTTGGAARLIEELRERQGLDPVWSPDGEWLAYAIDETLYRSSRDGRNREALATLYRWIGSEVRWSPDGRYIAALAYEKPEDWEEKNGVFVVSVADKIWKKVTPDNEERYKEALEWHPDSQRLTYHYNGPQEKVSQIRLAFIDGRPTEVMISQTDHWHDYGVWTPDGRQFVFQSDPCQGSQRRIHFYDTETKQITHAVRTGSLPQWSQDGKIQVWSQRGESLRRFEAIENFR